MLGYQPCRSMKHNFIADVVMKSNLRTNCKKAKVQHLHVQIVCMSCFNNSVY